MSDGVREGYLTDDKGRYHCRVKGCKWWIGPWGEQGTETVLLNIIVHLTGHIQEHTHSLSHQGIETEKTSKAQFNDNNNTKNATPCQRSSATEPLVISPASTVKLASDNNNESVKKQ